jgi:hypothetical protein
MGDETEKEEDRQGPEVPQKDDRNGAPGAGGQQFIPPFQPLLFLSLQIGDDQLHIDHLPLVRAAAEQRERRVASLGFARIDYPLGKSETAIDGRLQTLESFLLEGLVCGQFFEQIELTSYFSRCRAVGRQVTFPTGDRVSPVSGLNVLEMGKHASKGIQDLVGVFALLRGRREQRDVFMRDHAHDDEKRKSRAEERHYLPAGKGAYFIDPLGEASERDGKIFRHLHLQEREPPGLFVEKKYYRCRLLVISISQKIRNYSGRLLRFAQGAPGNQGNFEVDHKSHLA